MEVIHETAAKAYPEIVSMLREEQVTESRAGDTRELLDVAIVSDDPRSRWMYRDGYNLAFALQESFAYWQGLNPGHVERYNTNMETWMVNGILPGSAYGDRMRNKAGHDQIQRAIEGLRENPESRRHVIQVFQAHLEDFDGGDVSCTVDLHPMIRDGALHMKAHLRSQDMLWGFPYDMQNNQYIQEVMAGVLDVDVGQYVHVMDSCHYYTEYEDNVLQTLEDHEAHSAMDCRLSADDLEHVMSVLGSGLHKARNSAEPTVEWNELLSRKRYYADWLAVMVSYEQARYHDDPRTAAQWAGRIATPAWQEWSEDYAQSSSS